MPVSKCPNGKWRIGNGGCNFTSKEKAEAAYRAYLAQKHEAIVKLESKLKIEKDELIKIKEEIDKLK